MSRYTVNGKPWAIGIDVSDCKTSREVMQKAGLNYMVDKCPVVAEMPFGFNRNNILNEIQGDFSKDGKIYRKLLGQYATYRADNSTPLGLVKAKYEVVQNIDAFNFFDEAIGKDMAVWDKAGILNEGAQIYLSAKLPIETKVAGDPIENYLVFSNSHDGTTSVNIMFTPIRVICTNMLNAGLKSSDCFIRLRHTPSVKEKIERGARILKIACEHAHTVQEFYNSLTTVTMTDEQVMQYICELFLTKEEIAKVHQHDIRYGYRKIINRDYNIIENVGLSQRKVNQIINVYDYYVDGIGQQHIAGTAWGAYNAITGYYCNVANLEGSKRLESLLYGGANNNMIKALNQAYLLRKAA